MNQNPKKFLTCLLIKKQQLRNKQPEFIVTLNDVIQTPSDCLDDIVTFNLSAILGNNVLTIDLLNKNAEDTVVNGNGEIVNDLNLNVVKFYINGVDTTDAVKQQAKYLTCDNQLENTYGFMHKNGRLTIEFQCPLFYFLRDHVIR